MSSRPMTRCRHRGGMAKKMRTRMRESSCTVRRARSKGQHRTRARAESTMKRVQRRTRKIKKIRLSIGSGRNQSS